MSGDPASIKWACHRCNGAKRVPTQYRTVWLDCPSCVTRRHERDVAGREPILSCDALHMRRKRERQRAELFKGGES